MAHYQFLNIAFRSTAILLFTIVINPNLLWALPGDWVWINGSNEINQPATYGTKGVPSNSNRPSGRSSQATWSRDGVVWLFGGSGIGTDGNGLLNDLWKFETATGIWTWVNGSTAVNQLGVYGVKGLGDKSNAPGGRRWASSWMDLNGNLWLFGGEGYGGQSDGLLNDLWVYVPSTGVWTWIGGSPSTNLVASYGGKGISSPTNNPGGRSDSATWTDSLGNFYLFGGSIGTPPLDYKSNDVWKYEVMTGNWVWVNGSNFPDQIGNYGERRIPSSTNTPGARDKATFWGDQFGDLWMFGGVGFGTTSFGYLNDLWKFETIHNQWTWIKGPEEANEGGYASAVGTEDERNNPATRAQCLPYIDRQGNLRMFGGQSSVIFSDNWFFNTNTLNWMGIKVGRGSNAIGIYGNLNVVAPSNRPGSRCDSICWTDSNDNMYMFGGYGYGASTGPGYLNDLWRIPMNRSGDSWEKLSLY